MNTSELIFYSVSFYVVMLQVCFRFGEDWCLLKLLNLLYLLAPVLSQDNIYLNFHTHFYSEIFQLFIFGQPFF